MYIYICIYRSWRQLKLSKCLLSPNWPLLSRNPLSLFTAPCLPSTALYFFIWSCYSWSKTGRGRCYAWSTSGPTEPERWEFPERLFFFIHILHHSFIQLRSLYSISPHCSLSRLRKSSKMATQFWCKPHDVSHCQEPCAYMVSKRSETNVGVSGLLLFALAPLTTTLG